jgi:hypothetical protein
MLARVRRPNFCHATIAGSSRDFQAEMGRKFVTLSVGNSLCPYGIAYRKAYGLSASGLSKTSPCNPLCG